MDTSASRLRWWQTLVLATPLAVSVSGAQADTDRRSDTEEIAVSIYCYARGTDALGDAWQVTRLDLTWLTFNPAFGGATCAQSSQ
jgi:hypothetical protein